MKSKNRKLFIILSAVILLFLLGGTLYVTDEYDASPEALVLLSRDLPGITIVQDNDKIIFKPENVFSGLIFYPGGKVDHRAYAPLMVKLAQKGFFCVLMKMPLNFAFLNINAANDVYADFPEIEKWILAGHSLGGVMAACYASRNSAQLDGLVLLAAYSIYDLKTSGLRALSLYGSEDGVLNMDNYDKNRSKFPDDTVEIIVQGGNHAGFGSYGEQKGDGIAQISNEEQIRITAEEITTRFRVKVQ